MTDLSAVPDRALDAFLAAALFGVERLEETGRWGVPPERRGSSSWLIFYELPSYHDPSGALEVIEAMGEKGWRHEACYDHGMSGDEWACVFERPTESPAVPASVRAYGASFPRAVGEAAALALYPTAGVVARALLDPASDD